MIRHFVGMNVSYAFLAVLCLFSTGLAACVQPEPAAQAPPLRSDSLLTVVQGIDSGPLRAAFAGVNETIHTQYHRTEQFLGDGKRLAYRETVMRRTPSGSVVLRADTSGAFDFGYLARFVDEADAPSAVADLPGYVVPDDPPYASARNQEAFTYELERNAELNGRRVRAIDIRARPSTGDAQSIRRATLYLEESSDVLVAYRLERSDAALWFSEESLLFLSIDQDGSRWVPRQSRVETSLQLPFRPEQRFRSVMNFYGYEAR